MSRKCRSAWRRRTTPCWGGRRRRRDPHPGVERVPRAALGLSDPGGAPWSVRGVLGSAAPLLVTVGGLAWGLCRSAYCRSVLVAGGGGGVVLVGLWWLPFVLLLGSSAELAGSAATAAILGRALL